MELHRGQHPHAKSGGSWSIRNQAFESSGPVAWDDKIEIERAMWEERFVPKLGNGEGGACQIRPCMCAVAAAATRASPIHVVYARRPWHRQS